MNDFLLQVLSSAVVGMLSWGAGSVLNRLRTRNSAQSPAPIQLGQIPSAQAMTMQPPSPSVNFGKVLIHVGILQFVVNVLGFVIGFTVAAVGSSAGASPTTVAGISILLVLVFGTLAAIVAFLIIGLRVDTATRWQHLVFVALGTVILTLLVNAIIGQAETPPVSVTAAAIVFAFIQVFVAMGIGGGLATLFKPHRATPQYSAPVAAPNPYAAWQNIPQYPQAQPPQNAPQYPSQYPPQGAPWYPGAPGAPGAPGGPTQPGYGQPPQYPPQAPGGWGQQPGGQQQAPQQPTYPVPNYPPNDQNQQQGQR